MTVAGHAKVLLPYVVVMGTLAIAVTASLLAVGEATAAAPLMESATATSACAGAETCQDDPGTVLVELLQTGLQIGSLPHEIANKTGPPVIQTESPPEPCDTWPRMGAEPTPVNLQQLLLTMRFMGFLHEKAEPDCAWDAETISVLGMNRESTITPPRTATHIWATWLLNMPKSVWVLIIYSVTVFSVIGRLLFIITFGRWVSEKKITTIRPEQAAWNQGFVSWLCVSWATPWILRWGRTEDTENTTKIKSEDLGRSGFASDEAANAVEDWNRLWNEDIERRGKKIINIYRVIIRYCTYKKIVVLAIFSSLYEILMYVAPTFALDWTLRYINRVQQQRAVDPASVSMDSMLKPMFMVILFFTGMPLLMATFNTAAGFVSMRMNIRLEAALLSAVFQKAQRMPLSGGMYDLSVRDEDRDKQNAQGSGGDDYGRNYSLVQLVNADVNGNLMGFQGAFSKVILMIPITITLLTMLCLRLGKATLIVIATICGVIFLFGFTIRMSMIRMGWYQGTAGARLAFFMECMHAVRMVKSNGYEQVMATICNDTRKQEMTQLGWFYVWSGVTTTITMAYPKVLVLAGFLGYMRIHTITNPTDIFVMMQVLMAFKNCAMTLFTLLPVLTNVGPSVMRVDKMLKLDEAPAPGPKASEATAKWISVWPETPFPDGEFAVRIQGNFMYPTVKKMCLHDIDLEVHKGEMVAIMGEVGSGKSTLLLGLLGELAPSQDAHLEIPPKIAYHGQQPLICEATLKENVLYWADCNEERYRKAIYSACLLPDLEILPGGDQVMVGSRGISLSGGQRARVSLARAAYSESDAVILDDPFSAVDQPTGKHIMEKCLKGPLMKDKARVVVCQPDRHRVKQFDRVLLMVNSRQVLQGPPEEILQTPEYQALLSSFEARHLLDEPAAANEPGEGPEQADDGSGKDMEKSEPQKKLREEEHQGRTEWATFHYFFSMGKYRNLVMAAIFFVLQIVFNLFSDIAMARWSNIIQWEKMFHMPRSTSIVYIWAQIYWFALATACFLGYWYFGCRWSLNISGQIQNIIMDGLCHAPVDMFYDKTPVGRIMNRMSFDLFEIDIALFQKLAGSVVMSLSFFIPLIYVHAVMPFWLLCGSVPFYMTLYYLAKRFWNVMVPLRYLNSVVRSDFNTYIADVEFGSICSRAYQVSEIVAQKEMQAVDNMLKAGFSTAVISRWTSNRVLLMYAFYCTVVAVIGVLTQSNRMVGTIGLCLSNIIGIMMSAEGYLGQLTDAQFQFISMNRIHEYTSIPQERSHSQPSDYKYNSPVVEVQRHMLHGLEVRNADCRLKVVRRHPGGNEEVILVQHPNDESLIPPPGKTIAMIDPTCAALHSTAPWHRLHAVNGIARDAAKMGHELCRGNSAVVCLSIRSGWLFGGARIVVKDLVVGYADFPQDILHGISCTIEAKSKTAIAGTTGCGKSTFILCLLRLLEPRGGKIEINKVDLQDMGLTTLRKAVGLVSQDPVLFSGTLRCNLDPFSVYTDEELWESLRAVQLFDLVVKMGAGLDSHVRSDGANISFGQKQLLCIARQVLKKPELLMLDECTSAIDPHTQELVQSTIRSAFQDSTIVAIAHRLETIMDFDMVIVLQRGHVIEKGSIQELANTKNGVFAKMLAAKGQ